MSTSVFTLEPVVRGALTTAQAKEFVGGEKVFRALRESCELKPLFGDPAKNDCRWMVSELEAAMNAAQASGILRGGQS